MKLMKQQKISTGHLQSKTAFPTEGKRLLLMLDLDETLVRTSAMVRHFRKRKLSLDTAEIQYAEFHCFCYFSQNPNTPNL